MNKKYLKLRPVFMSYTKHQKYVIRSSGWSKYSGASTITYETHEISNLDLVLMSYLNSLHPKDINNSAIAKYLPYLYDSDYFNIINRDWENIQIFVEVYREDGSYDLMEPPYFRNLFDSTEEFEQYLKEEFDKFERIVDEEGEMLQPWELDEAKEVLAQAGWSKVELDHLRWVGMCRGFSAPLNDDALTLEAIIKNKYPELYDKKSIRDLIELAHNVETSIGFNGPDGYCGVYIYRVPKDMEVPKYSHLVIMPDGRKYVLHEGD